VCGSGEDKSTRYLWEFGFRSHIDWTNITDYPVSAMAYSSDDNLLYFTEEKNSDEQIIWKLDLENAEKS
jgi:hypothetical protein